MGTKLRAFYFWNSVYEAEPISLLLTYVTSPRNHKTKLQIISKLQYEREN